MVRGVNKVILVGNLGEEPTIRKTTNGFSVTNFVMVTNDQRKNLETGEIIETAEWHRIVLFGRSAEVAHQYLHKGSQVYIEGKLRTRSYVDKTNVKRYMTEIVADDMHFLGTRQQGNNVDMSQGYGRPNGVDMSQGYGRSNNQFDGPSYDNPYNNYNGAPRNNNQNYNGGGYGNNSYQGNNNMNYSSAPSYGGRGGMNNNLGYNNNNPYQDNARNGNVYGGNEQMSYGNNAPQNNVYGGGYNNQEPPMYGGNKYTEDKYADNKSEENIYGSQAASPASMKSHEESSSTEISGFKAKPEDNKNSSNTKNQASEPDINVNDEIPF